MLPVQFQERLVYGSAFGQFRVKQELNCCQSAVTLHHDEITIAVLGIHHHGKIKGAEPVFYDVFSEGNEFFVLFRYDRVPGSLLAILGYDPEISSVKNQLPNTDGIASEHGASPLTAEKPQYGKYYVTEFRLVNSDNFIYSGRWRVNRAFSPNGASKPRTTRFKTPLIAFKTI